MRRDGPDCIEHGARLSALSCLWITYWYKTRDQDNLRLLLMDEQQMVERAIQASDKKLNRKRLEQDRESARTADEIHQSALKIARNPDKADQFREEASTVVATLTDE